MTSRFAFLVAASLCAAVISICPVLAQSQVPLRASYEGRFLPEDTEIIVLSREGRVQRAGRYQPEFLGTDDVPRASAGGMRRDRLGDTGLTRHGYAGTQQSGRLYFIYALTPDSTLYWSYSAQRDSLKFDVVSTGVMSVAPVLASDVREDILQSLFRPRVTVVMPGASGDASERRADADEALDDGRTGGAGDNLSEPSLTGALLDSASVTTEGAPTPADAKEAAPIYAAAQVPMPQGAAASSPGLSKAASGITLPPLLAGAILLLLLAGIAAPAYLARTYHAELKRLRREMLAMRERMASGYATADAYARLEEDYEILRARCASLEKGESPSRRVGRTHIQKPAEHS